MLTSVFGISENWYKCCTYRDKMEEAKDAPRPHPKRKGKGKGKGKGKSPRTPRTPRTDRSATGSHEESLAPSQGPKAVPVGGKPQQSVHAEGLKPKETNEDIFLESMEMEETAKGNSGPMPPNTRSSKMPDLVCFDDRMNDAANSSVSDISEDPDYDKEVAEAKQKLEGMGNAMHYIRAQRQMTTRKLAIDDPAIKQAVAKGEGAPMKDTVGSASVFVGAGTDTSQTNPESQQLNMESQGTGSLESLGSKPALKKAMTREEGALGSLVNMDDYESQVHIRAKEVRQIMDQENFNAAPIYPTVKKRGRRKHVEAPKNPKVDEFHEIFHEKVAAMAALGVPNPKMELKENVDATLAVKEAVAKYYKQQEENADVLAMGMADRIQKGQHARVLLEG